MSAYGDSGNSSYSNEASDTTFFSGSGSDSRCFIATAVYGSEDHPPVKILRDFRDTYLLDNPIGRKFVQIYYHHSPFLANAIRHSQSLRGLVRYALIPITMSGVFVLYAGPFQKHILCILFLFFYAGSALADFSKK